METWLQRKAANACVRTVCAALALFVLFLAASARAETDGTLLVRLARLGAPSEIAMQANCDYTLADDPFTRIPQGTDMVVTASGDSIVFTAGGDILATGSDLRLMREGSGTQGLAFAAPALSNRFCGDLYFAASGGVIAGVLRIDVEDYLYGVVGCEMAPSSGLEALKAQAIVARSYALRKSATHSNPGYDLSDSGDVLSFRGYNDSAGYADVVRAVDETRGRVLCYGNSTAICYFCESNGGQTESSANAYGTSLPYSVVMDDPYDIEGGGLKKTASLRRDASDLLPPLRDALINGTAQQLRQQNLNTEADDIRITAIEDIACAVPRYDDPSRLYRALDFTLTVSGKNVLGEPAESRVTVRVPTYGGIEDWYDLSINDTDNETVWVSHTERAFEIAFRRSGSGVGMSQRGAQAMARKGLSCETILEYYYPGAELRTVQPEGSAREAASAADSVQPIATARLSQKCRLYENADNGSAVLNTLPAGATVSVYAVQDEWAAIGSGDLYGFIHSEALASFSLLGVSAAPVQDETFAQISAGPVEVLQLPVRTAKALEALNSGASVRLNAYTDEWALVTTASGVEGFIPRDALTLQADSADDSSGGIVTVRDDLYGLLTEDADLFVNADDSIAPHSSLEKGVYVRILAYNSAWAYVRTADDQSGYIKLNCLSAVQHTPAVRGDITKVKGKLFLYVADETLPLYRSNSTDSDVLVILKRGDRVRVGAYNDEWACVRAEKTTGFVLKTGLIDSAPSDATTGPEGGKISVVKGEVYAAVTEDEAPVYPSWSDADTPIAVLSTGTRVQVGAYNGKWACVRTDGVTGFMRIETIEMEK